MRGQMRESDGAKKDTLSTNTGTVQRTYERSQQIKNVSSR